MKQHISPIALINKRFRIGRAGGVTLEAALVMPMFLMLAFFLISLVQTAIVSMALHGALSQTVRQAAAAWYPVSLGATQATSSELAEWLPSPLKELADEALRGDLSLEQQGARIAFDPLLKQFTDRSVLDPSRISISTVHLPQSDDSKQPYLTIEAEYRLPFQFPFIGKRLFLRESASERVWIGGTPSQSKRSDSKENPFAIAFVSLEPNPAKPGRKVTLVLRTTPGTEVDLSVVYKSGESKAKHLGRAAADEKGLVSWTWHVSGRTTPGEWQWVASNGTGGKWQQSFQVAGKSNPAGEVAQ